MTLRVLRFGLRKKTLHAHHDEHFDDFSSITPASGKEPRKDVFLTPFPTKSLSEVTTFQQDSLSDSHTSNTNLALKDGWHASISIPMPRSSSSGSQKETHKLDLSLSNKNPQQQQDPSRGNAQDQDQQVQDPPGGNAQGQDQQIPSPPGGNAPGQDQQQNSGVDGNQGNAVSAGQHINLVPPVASIKPDTKNQEPERRITSIHRVISTLPTLPEACDARAVINLSKQAARCGQHLLKNKEFNKALQAKLTGKWASARQPQGTILQPDGSSLITESATRGRCGSVNGSSQINQQVDQAIKLVQRYHCDQLQQLQLEFSQQMLKQKQDFDQKLQQQHHHQRKDQQQQQQLLRAQRQRMKIQTQLLLQNQRTITRQQQCIHAQQLCLKFGTPTVQPGVDSITLAAVLPQQSQLQQHAQQHCDCITRISTRGGRVVMAHLSQVIIHISLHRQLKHPQATHDIDGTRSLLSFFSFLFTSHTSQRPKRCPRVKRVCLDFKRRGLWRIHNSRTPQNRSCTSKPTCFRHPNTLQSVF